MMIAPRALALLPVLALLACSASPKDSPSAASLSAGGSAAAGGQSGVPILTSNVTGTPGAGSCVPSAPSTFANAICVCEWLSEAGVLRTHATAPGAASVGVDGLVAAATGSDIEGSLTAYAGLSVGGSLSVRDAAWSTGNVAGVGKLQVGGDLSCGGDFTFAGDLQLGGALRLAQSGVVIGSSQATTAPYVAPSGAPCDCAPNALLPIAALVAAAASNNDNAALGLGTTGADLVGAGNLSLPTGSYYFKDLTRVGAGTITITGAVALYLDGSIAQVGDEQIKLAPGASLDLYVTGLVATVGKIALGDASNPGAFRMFIGGAGSMMATAGDQVWNGLVYAPEADIAFAGVTRLHGAVFAKSLAWAGVLDVTYDGISSSTPCTPPPSSPPPSGGPGSTSSPNPP